MQGPPAVALRLVPGCVAFLWSSLPAQTPEMVGPGVVSTDSAYEMNAAFSPDGATLWFSRCRGTASARSCRILSSTREGSGWSAPRVAPFSGTWSDFDPSLTPDGRRLLFLSRRPRPGQNSPRPDWDVWVVERQGDAWGTPGWMGAPISTDTSEYFTSFTPAGHLILSAVGRGGLGAGDIFLARRTPEGFAEPENLGPAINSPHFESDPVVSVDGRYLLFTSYGRPEGPGHGDLYVSYRKGETWLPAEPLDGVNTPARECCAVIAPDGNTLVFTREVNGQGMLFQVPSGAAGLPPVHRSGTATVEADSIRLSHVAGRVHLASVYTRYRANVTISTGSDGTLLVDVPARNVVDTIERLVGHLSPYGVRTVVATHWHADHTGGNAAFGGRVPLIAHRTVRDRRAVRQTPSWAPGGISRLPRHGWPDVTFADSLALQWNGERVLLLHFGPAHTDGDIVVLFEGSGVAAVGDLFHGRGRVAGPDMHSGNPTGMARVLASLVRRLPPGTRVITGHGEVATVADLADFSRRFTRSVELAMESDSTAPTHEFTALWDGWDVPPAEVGRLYASLHQYREKGGTR